jgi:hypothetical protein
MTWTLKLDRRLVEIARSTKNLEEAAKQLGRPPKTIKKVAMRLGLPLKSRYIRPKAKKN